MTGFTLHKLHRSLGAEVRGLDLAQPLDSATRDALIEAWLEHMVLLFRGQELSPETQRRFCENFGLLGERSRKADDRPEGAGVEHEMLVTNVRRDGVPIGSLPDGEMYFHHDKCYVPVPDWGTMLYAMVVTDTGGHTLFANMCEALETLPADLRSSIDGRRVLHMYKYHPTERVELEDDIGRHDHCWQPAVVTHPRSGRRALYINELMTALIDGYSEEESHGIRDALMAHVRSADVIYEHKWKKGDLVMWDNWCTMHARTDFPPEQTRMLRRYTIRGQALTA